MTRLLLLLALLTSTACATLGEGDPARDLHFDSIVVDGHSDTTPRFARSDWEFTAFP